MKDSFAKERQNKKRVETFLCDIYMKYLIGSHFIYGIMKRETSEFQKITL